MAIEALSGELTPAALASKYDVHADHCTGPKNAAGHDSQLKIQPQNRDIVAARFLPLVIDKRLVNQFALLGQRQS